MARPAGGVLCRGRHQRPNRDAQDQEGRLMIILGLDIATTTGFAWYEPGSSLSSIKTGLIKAEGDNAEEKAASLAQQIVAMFKAGRPDFVAIEQPMRNVVSFRKTRQDFGGEVEEQTINPN